MGLTMNLISGIHHFCERREYSFNIVREYSIIIRDWDCLAEDPIQLLISSWIKKHFYYFFFFLKRCKKLKSDIFVVWWNSLISLPRSLVEVRWMSFAFYPNHTNLTTNDTHFIKIFTGPKYPFCEGYCFWVLHPTILLHTWDNNFSSRLLDKIY